MKYIIDRFEGECAVLEDEDENNKVVPKTSLPADSKEGYVIELIDGIYEINYTETEERRKKMQERMNRFRR